MLGGTFVGLDRIVFSAFSDDKTNGYPSQMAP
jgi:hypothetical protein